MADYSVIVSITALTAKSNVGRIKLEVAVADGIAFEVSSVSVFPVLEVYHARYALAVVLVEVSLAYKVTDELPVSFLCRCVAVCSRLYAPKPGRDSRAVDRFGLRRAIFAFCGFFSR
jgi:hypothetical protein